MQKKWIPKKFVVQKVFDPKKMWPTFVFDPIFGTKEVLSKKRT